MTEAYVKFTFYHKLALKWVLPILLATGFAGIADQARGQAPFGTIVRNRGTATYEDKSKVSFTKESNEVRTPVNPSIVKQLETDIDTVMVGDRIVYRLIIDNRGGDAINVALRDTIDDILDITEVIGNASVLVEGQVVLADWTPFDADRVDTIRVVAYLRSREPMPDFVRNQAWMTVNGVLMGTEIIELPIKDIGRTADGEIEQPEYLVPGETLLVTVRDEDLNTNRFVVEQVDVRVVNSRTGETETVTLRATGPDSDEFTGLLPTKLEFGGAGPDNDGTMHVEPADRLQGIYYDERTEDGPPLERTDATTILPTTITLEPSPRTIIGNGVDQAILKARVTDSLGRPLPDGTPVRFTTDKGKFPNGLKEIVIPVSGGDGEAEAVFTAPILDSSDAAHVVASFGGFDSDTVNLQVLPGALGIRVFDQVRGVDVTSLDDQLVVELTVYGVTATGQPFGPITIAVDEDGLFSSDLLPPGTYTFITRVRNIETGQTVLENEPQQFTVNFDGSVTAPKNSIAGTLRPRGQRFGDQFSGLTVQLLDEFGNVIGEVITDEHGRYEFEGLDPGLYTLRIVFADGTASDTPIDQRSRLIGQIIVNVDVLIDPFGQTFDGQTRQLVPNVTVAIRTLDGQVLPIPLLAGTGAAPNVNNINPFVANGNARFAFLFGGTQVGTFGSPAIYHLTATPPTGSSYLPRTFRIEVQPAVSGPVTSSTPIQLTARSADGLELAEPNAFKLTTDDVFIDNIAVVAINIPMFQQAPQLQLTKSTVEDTLGTNVPFEYTLIVSNIGNDVAQSVTIADTLNPVVWRLVSADGASIPAPNIAIWNIGDLLPGEADTVRLGVEILSPQVNGLQVINRASARMSRGFPVTAESGVIVSSSIRASAITLEPDPKTIVGNGTDFSYLTARVIDNDGNPLPDGTPVRFTADIGRFGNGLQTIIIPISGGNGEAVAIFTAPVLTANDTARVFASFDNVASNTVNLEVLPGAIGVRVWDQVRGIEVKDGDTNYRVEATLIGRSAIGEPIAHTVTIDKNGVFPIPDIPPGTYRFKAIVTDIISGEIVSDGLLQNISVNFDGSTSQPLNAVGGRVKGRTESTGARFAGLPVELLDQNGSVIRTSVIDANGDYDFQGLSPGRYSVRFSLPDGEVLVIPVSSRSRLSGTVVINVNVLIDPFGKTYDAVTQALIPNVRVTIETATGQALPLPALSGTGAVPNTNNVNPYNTDAEGRFSFLFGGDQVGAFGNPVRYYMTATSPDSVYLPRRLIMDVQPANPGPVTSDSPITMNVTSGDVLEIARPNSFTLTRAPQTIANIAVVALNIPMFKTAPFLELTKTAAPDSVAPTEQARFDIVVKNTGNETAVGVTVVDTLTTAWRLISGSAGGQIVAPNIVRWNVGDMAPGQVDSLWLQVELVPPQLGGVVVTNTAHATTPRGLHVDDSAQVKVNASPTWQILVRPLVNVVGPGDEIPWVVRFKNIGNSLAHNFDLVDSLPPTHSPMWVVDGQGDTTGVSGTLGPVSHHLNPFTPGGVISGQTITWLLRDFEVGEEDSAMFVSRVSDTLPPRTVLDDFSYIIGPGNRVWAASAAAIASRGPKLEIVKEAMRDTVNAGEIVEFRIITRNNEKVPTAGAISLIDSLPPSMQFVSAVGKPVTGGSVLNWTVSSLAPGQADTLIISVRILTDDPLALNKAILRYFNEELYDDATVNVKPAPTLSLTKTVDHALVEPGQQLEYTIAMNALGDSVKAITVADTLPRELAYVRDSSVPAAAYDSLGHILTWSIASVTPGAQTVLTFRLTPTPGLPPGEHPTRNIAIAATTDTTAISNPADAVISVPFFVVSKRADQSVAEMGDFVVYRITIENLSSNDPLTNVRVWDRLPHSFKYVDETTRLDGVSHEPETVIGRDIIWRIPVLAASQVMQMTYRAVVGADALSGDGTNTVNATASTPSGNTVSAGPARATVRIRPDAFSQSQVVIGRAWVDENDNGLHDDGEPPVPGVAFLMEDGTRIVADQTGRFSIPEIRAGAHVLRLLQRNVPGNLEPVELGVRSARDPWIRFVDVVQAGLTKANFPFRRLPEPPGSSLYKTASVVAPPARFWIERLVRADELGASKEEASLSLDLLTDASTGGDFTSLTTDIRREAAGASAKITDDGSLKTMSDPAGATPKALDTRFRVVYRVYSLGSYEDALMTILQNAPQGYIWAPPYQQNSGSIVPGDSLTLRLAADVNDLPILPQPRIDLQNVRYLRADSTMNTRSIQLTLQSLGRSFSDSTVREVWYVELDLPSVPKAASSPRDSVSGETPAEPVSVYSGGKVEYTFEVHANGGGEVVDQVPPGMKPVATDRLATVSGDTIRWALPSDAGAKDYRFWARMAADTDTTVTVLNKATLFEEDRQSNQLVPGPQDSADVTIKPLPKWEVSSFITPESVYVEIENTVLQNLGADSFISGSAVLIDVVQAQLIEVRNRLFAAPTQNILITGHTDSNPIHTAQYPDNFVLSRARANAVKGWLIAAGVDSSRIIIYGYGPTKPVASNKTAEGRRQNRRVELELIETVVDRLPYKVELTRTTTMRYLGTEILDQVQVADSLSENLTYISDTSTILPLISPGVLRWILKDVRPGETFTVSYKCEAAGVASGNVEFIIPTTVSYSLPDGQWLSNPPVNGKSAWLIPQLNEEVRKQQGAAGG